MTTGEYEFTEQQNETFSKLSATVKRFALVFGAFGVALIMLGIVTFLTGAYEGGNARAGIIVAGLVCVVVAFLFFNPTESFYQITTTKGMDISNLVAALKDLNTAVNLLRISVAVIVLARLIGFIAARMG
jgi:hypothetical protein